ncbi:MAG TPA: putative metal-dependent hydrolase [Candidatus Acidoferrum sp.]|nr:putative metal-dependent hydrolase [Candidatus Acidoferrum sp.]
MPEHATQEKPVADPRYPVGKYQKKGPPNSEERKRMIASLAETPAKLRAAVAGLNDKQLDTPYRPGGWTVRQVVHHMADSHMNMYIRFRFGVTEPDPPVKPYDEATWAKLFDARTAPAEVSLAIVDGLHQRLVMLMHEMREIDFMRSIVHPEHGKMSLDDVLSLYEWHGRHHVAHITTLRQQMGW